MAETSEDLIARLRAAVKAGWEISRPGQKLPPLPNAIAQAADALAARDATIAEQAARIEALEAGLRPFANYAEATDTGWATDDSSIAEEIVGAFRRSIRIGDLRRARALLEPKS